MATSSSKYYSRFIPREEIEDATRWQFDAVFGAGTPLPAMGPPESAPIAPAPAEPGGMDEALHRELLQQARGDGYQQGLAEGKKQAEQEWSARLDDYVDGQGRAAAGQLAALAQALEASLGGLQQAMAQELLQLACDVARQVVRQELSVNTRAMLPVVREALAMLVEENRPATVRVHPEDWTLLERPLREEFGGARVQWHSDATLARGDCRVESAGMVVDGALEQRWRRAIAALGLAAAWREAGDGD